MGEVSETEAKRHLFHLIAGIERTGDEVIIHRRNVPVAKLVPFWVGARPRELGGWEGAVELRIDFDQLPDELGSLFAG
jgi:prevent-host-death family protein